MFTIQQRKSSICKTVLLTLLLEFTFADTSISNQKTCRSRNTRSISYFKLDDKEVNWNEAWRLCKNRSSTLPVICNQHEQDALTNFLKTNIGSSAAWTSGKKIPFDRWTWVDGTPFNNIGVIKVDHESYTHVAIIVDRSYKAQSPVIKNYYLCQYSGPSCNSENDIRVTNGCVRPSDDDRTWYDARNQCLRNGGDLPILKDADLGILGNLSIRRINDKPAIDSYWIGLRNNTWRWIWQETVPSGGSGEEVIYSNWSNDTHYTSYECISIDASNGEWKAVRCTDKKKVVCQGNHTSSSTTSRTTTSTMSGMSNPTSSKSSSTTPTKGDSNTNSYVLLYSGAGAGILIIVICIIVIILAVRYTRKSPKNMDQSKGENNSEQNKRNESPNKPAATLATSPTSAPANAPVAEADDSRGLYAEISLATLNQREDGAKTQQPGIVYAALEFQKEPTYLEPDKKRAHTTDQTKVGPMGDVIYAIPDAKSHAANSSGNESASHPTKVTTQGDIYALPVKNSKSPNANPSHGGIYENL